MVVHSTVTSNLDYCNMLCVDALETIQMQQPVWLLEVDHGLTVGQLHWPPINFQVQFKMLVLTLTLYALGQGYLGNCFLPYNLALPLRSSGKAVLLMPLAQLAEVSNSHQCKEKKTISTLQIKAMVVMHPTCLNSPSVMLKRTAAISSLKLGLMAAFNYGTLQLLLLLLLF